MKPLRVLVVHNSSMLSSALQSMLLSGAELNVVNSMVGDVEALVSEINSLEPDVVVLGQWIQLSENEPLGQLLNCHSRLRLMVISDDTNLVHVFRKDELVISSAADFLDAIYSG